MKTKTLLLILLAIVLTSMFTQLFINYEKLRQEIVLLKQVDSNLDLQVQCVEKQVPHIAKYIQIVKSIDEKAGDLLTTNEKVDIAKLIVEFCALNEDVQLTPDLILALIERESNFNPNAISSARAYGLTQCIQGTFDRHLPEMGFEKFSVALATRPLTNVEVGMRELIRLRRYWIEEGVDNWMIPLHSYFWGTRWTWSLLTTKKRVDVPSLEYGKGVLDLAKEWKQRGI